MARYDNLKGYQRTEINWFPGHMAKTKRLISENLKEVDIVIELLDARIPRSSRNPDIAALCGGKPMLTLLNKTTLADPEVTKRWVRSLKDGGGGAIPIDAVSGDGLSSIVPAIRELLAEKLERYDEKGMSGRRLRAMIVGIPNVGKSSLINRLAGGARAKVENRPGVTRDKQWITTRYQLDLLDMPGVLWPKLGDRLTGENLAFTGAVKDGVLDVTEIGGALALRLYEASRDKLAARYKLDPAAIAALRDGCDGDEPFKYALLEQIGRRRGFLISGGEVDLEHTANMLLEEFRSAKIGRISLEAPYENNSRT